MQNVFVEASLFELLNPNTNLCSGRCSVCSDPQQSSLHDCMHWVQSDGIFPWLMFYLRVVYVFMTVPVTKLLSNLYYGFGWSCGAQDTGCSTLHIYVSELPIMLHCVPGPGDDMHTAAERETRADNRHFICPRHSLSDSIIPETWNKWYLAALTHPKQKLNHI